MTLMDINEVQSSPLGGQRATAEFKTQFNYKSDEKPRGTWIQIEGQVIWIEE